MFAELLPNGDEKMRARSDFGLVKRKINSKAIYYYYIYDDNKRVYRSTGQKTKAKALDYVLDLRDNGRLGCRDRSMVTLGEITKDFYFYDRCPIVRNAEMRGRKITKSTCYSRRKALDKHILPHLGKMPISSITAAKVDKWLMNLPETDNASRTSANCYYDTLKQVMDEIVRQGIVPSNPCNGTERLGSDSVRRQSFTVDEVKAIIGEPEDWDNVLIRLMCLTAALTGMRMGEVLALKPEAVTDTAIHIKASFSIHDGYKTPKNGKDRVAPIPQILVNQLRLFSPRDGGYIFRMVGDKPLSAQYVLKKLKERMDAVGVKRKTFHSFRAFFNTEMMADNVNETIVRSVIGHQSADMTEHYLHLETGEFSAVRKTQDRLLEKIKA